VSFHADAGSVLSLIGPNGSGKSTFLRCLSGLLRPSAGTITLAGRALDEYRGQDVARHVAFLPQFHERFPGVTVEELVAMGRAPYHRSGWGVTADDKAKVAWAIEYMQIGHLKDREVETLSGGEKQRVWIALVLAQDTPVILLDEPVTYRDLKHQWDLLALLRNLRDGFGKTIIGVFHDVNHALVISDCVYLLKEGTVYDSGLSEEVINEQSIHDVYGVRTRVHRFTDWERSVVVPYADRNGATGVTGDKEEMLHACAHSHLD
jgi:iron complex transport system ATP-binding protein